MNVRIRLSDHFLKQAKRLQKRHNSLRKDVSHLIEGLMENPSMGIPLAMDCFKIRMAIKNKNKGKSGGARIVTHVLVIAQESQEGVTEVTLLAIYDKGETNTISDDVLAKMLQEAIEA